MSSQSAFSLSGHARQGHALWFLSYRQVEYGPYSEAQILQFIDEGRVASNSLLANIMSGSPDVSDYAPAQNYDAIRHKFAAAPSEEIAGDIFETSTETAYTNPVGEAQYVMVYAAINSANNLAFHDALAKEGELIAVHDFLWLVITDTSINDIRNRLSRVLEPIDRLVVFETSKSQLAWFNLGYDADMALREKLEGVG